MDSINTAVSMFNAGNVLRNEFERYQSGTEDEKARRRSLIIPLVVVYVFGIETALKAIIKAQGGKPWGHDLLELYRELSDDNKGSVNRKILEKGVNASDAKSVLEYYRNSFQEWRYMEDMETPLLAAPGTLEAILYSIITLHTEKYGEMQQEQASRGETGVPQTIQNEALEYVRRIGYQTDEGKKLGD